MCNPTIVFFISRRAAYFLNFCFMYVPNIIVPALIQCTNITPSGLHPTFLRSGLSFFYSAVWKSQLCFNHLPDSAGFTCGNRLAPFSWARITFLKKRSRGSGLSLVFFPFKNYAALAVVIYLGSLEKSAERERGDKPSRRDHGGTSRTGHPT